MRIWRRKLKKWSFSVESETLRLSINIRRSCLEDRKGNYVSFVCFASNTQRFIVFESNMAHDIGLAIALIGGSKVVFLDEPSMYMDLFDDIFVENYYFVINNV